MIDINERLTAIKKRISELDSLIEDTLNHEPDKEAGTYGEKIRELFEDTSWIDCVIHKIE